MKHLLCLKVIDQAVTNSIATPYTGSQFMGKTLAQSNIYLRDTKQRLQAMARNIESSSAIEGIKLMRDTKNGCFVSNNKKSSNPKPIKSS